MNKLYKRLSHMDLYTLVVIDDFVTFLNEVEYLVEMGWEVVLNPKKPLDTCN